MAIQGIKYMQLWHETKTEWEDIFEAPKETHQNNDESESIHDNTRLRLGYILFSTFFEAFMDFWNPLFWVYNIFVIKIF